MAYRSYYRYRQPRPQEYVSTFVPLPLDYLNQSMMSRQAEFDKNQMMVNEALDKYAGFETVPGGDTTHKNQLLDETFNNIYKIVQEKYGGDYSQAGSEIMSSIVALRKKPFWNYSAQHLTDWKQKKAIVDEMRIKGELGWASDMNQSVVDENGGYRLPNYEIYSRPDLIKQYKDRYAGLLNKSTENISKADVEGYLQMEKITGLTRDQIDKEIGIEDAKRILQENPVLMKMNPAYAQDPELFRREMVDDLSNISSRRSDKQLISDKVWDFKKQITLQNIQYERQRALEQTKQNAKAGQEKNFLLQTGYAPYNDATFDETIETAKQQGFYDNKVTELAKQKGLDIKTFNELEDRILKTTVLPGWTKLSEKQLKDFEENKKLKAVRNDLEKEFKESLKTVAPEYRISNLLSASPEDIRDVNTINKSLVEEINTASEYFTPEFKSNKELEKALKEKKIIDYSGVRFDPDQNGLRFTVVYENSKGSKQTGSIRIAANVNDPTNSTYMNMLGYLAQIGEKPRSIYMERVAKAQLKSDFENFEAKHPDKSTEEIYQLMLEDPSYNKLAEYYKSYKNPLSQ